MTGQGRPDSVPRAPATAEDALEAVLRRFGQPRTREGDPVPLRVREFDLGYVVHAVFPPPPLRDGVRRPAEPGGSHVMVAKADGAITTFPNYPPEQVIELFRRRFRPDSPQPGTQGGTGSAAGS